jgi:hypothetical protein
MSLMQTAVILSARTVIKRRPISREIGEKKRNGAQKGRLTKKGVLPTIHISCSIMNVLVEQQSDEVQGVLF